MKLELTNDQIRIILNILYGSHFKGQDYKGVGILIKVFENSVEKIKIDSVKVIESNKD